MKMIRHEPSGKIEVILSRRNLEAMLAKLNGHPPNSGLTALGSRDDAPGLILRVEENEPHYAHRGGVAGEVHPETEAAIEAMRS